MARVPVVGGNQLALGPMAEQRIVAQDFSAGWREAGAAGARLGEAVVRFGEEQDALQAQLDQAAAKKLDTDYAQFEREVLHTGEAAFYTQEGFNASNMRLTVEEQLEKKRQELLGTTANPRQRAMASDALERRIGAARQGIADYSNRQLRVEETRQSARRAASASDDAVLYQNDPVRFEEEIAVGLAEIRGELAKQGAAPETIQFEADKYRSGVYRRVAAGFIDKLEIDKAISYVAGNRGNLTAEDQADLDKALAVPLMDRKIDGLADYIMGDGRPEGVTNPVTPDGEAAGDPDQLAKGFALPFPVDGRITSGFGKRAAPKQGASTNHLAIDIAAPDGTPIRSQAAGRVVSAKDEGNAGLVVRVDYGNGVVASYAHMQGFNVREGDAVKPGQVLGGVGRTGNVTGSHVHYTLRVNGQKVDPTKFAGVTGRPSGGTRGPTQASGLTQEDAIARIEDLGLPIEEERALKQEVASRFRDDKALQNEREERARDSALEILNRADAEGRPISRESAIPGAVWDSLSPSDAMAIRADIRRNAAGPERETNTGTFLQLSDLYATDPKRFARLNPLEFRDQLSKEDFEQVFGTWRRDALQGEAKKSKAQVTHDKIRSVMAPALVASGLTLDGIPTKDAEERQRMARRIYAAQKAVQAEVDLYLRENPGKPVTDDFIRNVVDRQLAPTRRFDDKPEEGTFFGIGSNVPTVVPWFERKSLGTREVAVVIPAKDRERLRRLGRQELGREPTEKEISFAYFEELRR